MCLFIANKAIFIYNIGVMAMKYVKRFFYTGIVFIFIFGIIAFCVHFMSKGYTNNYSINNDIKVKEIYTKDEQDEHNNYYIEIKANNVVFNYQFYKNIKKDKKLVNDVLYYDGEYKCVLPILDEDIKVDFQCYKNGEYFNYVDLIGKDSNLDKYIKKHSKKYDKDLFNRDNAQGKEYEKVYYFSENIPDGYAASITNLKGIISVVDEIVGKVELFEKDVYRRDISAFVDYYYVSANYDDKQEFSEFYVVNMMNGKTEKVKTPDYISFDSYVQGIVDNSVYVYDINNERQYKLNVKDMNVTEVGNADKGIKYFDGNWSLISAIKANDKVLFKNNGLKESNKFYLYKKGNKLSGFNYYFYESESGYDVYRSNVQNNKVKKYLFSVKNPEDVQFIEDYVFFKYDDRIKMYSDYTGIKTILKTSELEYNDNIKYIVYKKA